MTELKNIPSSQSKSNYSLIRLDRMYESLRYNEYSMESGLGEIVDNSVEAQAARIKIDITTEKSQAYGKKKSKAQRTDYPNCCCRRRIWYGGGRFKQMLGFGRVPSAKRTEPGDWTVLRRHDPGQHIFSQTIRSIFPQSFKKPFHVYLH